MNRSNTKLTHIKQLKGQYKSFIQQALLKKFRGGLLILQRSDMTITLKCRNFLQDHCRPINQRHPLDKV